MLKIDRITVSFDGNEVIKDFSLEINDRATAIMGASGCGKTTLLNAISGLIKPEKGEIHTDGARISYVFGEPRLLLWYTAEKNIRIVNKNITDERLNEIIDACEITDFKDKLPTELSAGMAQRVSIARGLAYEGDILLMDEPFKALDPDLKQRIMQKTSELFNGKHMIFITHEESEASTAADRVITVKSGPLTITSDFGI